MMKARRRTAKNNNLFGFEADMAVLRTYNPFSPDELRQALGSEQEQIELIKTCVFDPDSWLEIFSESQKNTVLKRALRIIVQMGTVCATLSGQYTLAYTQEEILMDRQRLQRSVEKTVLYASDEYFVSEFRNNGSAGWTEGKAAIRIVDADPVAVAEKIMEIRPDHQRPPAILVIASKGSPGGGYKRGAGSQEEELVRRSTLLHNLEDPYGFDPARDWSYPLPEFGGAYSPDVAVLRDSENDGYGFREEPTYVSFINVAPYPSGQVNNGLGSIGGGIAATTQFGRKYNNIAGDVARNYFRKMEVILNIARDQGHQSIVLGAFGCNSGSTPSLVASEIALMWKEVIETSPYAFREFFDDIAFALPVASVEKGGIDESPEAVDREGSLAATFSEVFGVKIDSIDFF